MSFGRLTHNDLSNVMQCTRQRSSRQSLVDDVFIDVDGCCLATASFNLSS